MKKEQLKNQKVKDHKFLEGMYLDPYFPSAEVAKIEQVLVNLCGQIEQEEPKSLEDLYALTHEATNKINNLQEDFFAAGSEIETVAREVIAMEFEFVAKAYGFENADLEMLIATRDW